jgi:hypothetical protein
MDIFGQGCGQASLRTSAGAVHQVTAGAHSLISATSLATEYADPVAYT